MLFVRGHSIRFLLASPRSQSRTLVSIRWLITARAFRRRQVAALRKEQTALRAAAASALSAAAGELASQLSLRAVSWHQQTAGKTKAELLQQCQVGSTATPSAMVIWQASTAAQPQAPVAQRG